MGLFNVAPSLIVARILVLMIALTLHEFAHAAAANALGDDTPRIMGRLTINPFAHLDIMGTLMMIFVGFGWAKPVPVNPYTLQRRSRAGLMLVSLAGPLTNLLLGLIAVIPLRLLWHTVPTTSQFFLLPSFRDFLLIFVYMNIALFIFNMIPLAPLDGEKILMFFLPPNMAREFEKIRPFAPFLLMLLLFAGSFLGFNIIQKPVTGIVNLLLGL